MFALKEKSEKREIKYIKNPTKEQIEQELSENMTMVKYDGGAFFIYINDEYERDRVKEAIGVPHFEWFHETTGLKQWVLYNPKQYKVEYNSEDKFILRFNHHDYNGDPLDAVINASSLCSMFSWMQLPDNISFDRRFELSEIYDTTFMFAGCVLPPNFTLDDRFDLKNVLNTRFMFYQCSINNSSFFGNILHIENSLNIEYMFAESAFHKDIELLLNTGNAKCMDRMFFNTVFYGKCILGDGFVYPHKCKKREVFRDARRENEILTGKKLEEVREILER